MPDYTRKTGVCLKCQQPREALLHRQFRGNGSVCYLWVCSVCRKRGPFSAKELFIPNEKVEAVVTCAQRDALPTIMPPLYGRCAVCGSRDAEAHHWAPRKLFGDDCEKWPQDYLCAAHHAEWHHRVTPKTEGPPNA